MRPWKPSRSRYTDSRNGPILEIGPLPFSGLAFRPRPFILRDRRCTPFPPASSTPTGNAAGAGVAPTTVRSPDRVAVRWHYAPPSEAPEERTKPMQIPAFAAENGAIPRDKTDTTPSESGKPPEPAASRSVDSVPREPTKPAGHPAESVEIAIWENRSQCLPVPNHIAQPGPLPRPRRCFLYRLLPNPLARHHRRRRNRRVSSRS